MRCIVRKQLQILDPVIGTIAVDVMNDLTRFEPSTHVLLHYPAVLIQVTSLSSIWMIWHTQQDIAILVRPTATLPCDIFRAKLSALIR